MNNFESQLTASARRLRNEQDKQLSVAPVPQATRRHQQMRRISWGWYATPAAAMIGLLIGFSIPRPTEQQQTTSPIITLAADTTTAPLGYSLAEDNTDYSLFVRL